MGRGSLPASVADTKPIRGSWVGVGAVAGLRGCCWGGADGLAVVAVGAAVVATVGAEGGLGGAEGWSGGSSMSAGNRQRTPAPPSTA